MPEDRSKPIKFTISEGVLSLVVGGKPLIVDQDHPSYTKIKDAVYKKNWERVRDLIDVAGTIEREAKDTGILVRGGVLYFKGKEIHNALGKRIIAMVAEANPRLEAMKLFLENCLANPWTQAVDELMGFLDKNDMPITEDGHFLAYKKVTRNYTDCHSGRFCNEVGAVVEMKREDCDSNRNNHCSRGLHFCSLSYLGYFGGSSSDRVVIVKINPKDVTSFPSDMASKGRCCKYTVVGEHERSREADKKDSLAEKPVMSKADIKEKFAPKLEVGDTKMKGGRKWVFGENRRWSLAKAETHEDKEAARKTKGTKIEMDRSVLKAEPKKKTSKPAPKKATPAKKTSKPASKKSVPVKKSVVSKKSVKATPKKVTKKTVAPKKSVKKAPIKSQGPQVGDIKKVGKKKFIFGKNRRWNTYTK